MRVEDCSYSTLKELESLSRLTALALEKCSGDVIYNDLGFSFKLTRYALSADQQDFHTSLMDKYDRVIVLEVTETTPLGDWICPLLRKSECVYSRGKGSKNVLTELQLDEFQNLKDLRLADCDSLTHMHCQNNIPFPELEKLEVSRCNHLQYVFCVPLAGGSSTVACPDDDEDEEVISRNTHIGPERKMVQVIKFPNLYSLELQSLVCFTHFCNDTVEGIEFPQLRFMRFCELWEFQNFWPTANNCINDSSPLFDEKVSCPSLEELHIWMVSSISALCSHQLPTAYFSNLKKLEVWHCGKLRNLMSPSVARGLLNLWELDIGFCWSMEEVITEEEHQGEEITNQPLFPRLGRLDLQFLPKLEHFFRTKCALEFSFLENVEIVECLEMKTFVQQGSVSTPSLESVSSDNEVEVVDLNKAMFNFKVSCPSLVRLELDGVDSITALCSHQLPTGYFSKLKKLDVTYCDKLRNLMPPSVARGLLNLRELDIGFCESMEEVITEEEQQGEEMTIEPLFPRLKQLELRDLPTLGHFFLTKRALEFPLLRYVTITRCPEMKMFVQQGSVSIPRLESVNKDDEVEVVDLNKAIQQRFDSKEEDDSESETSSCD